MLSTKETRLIDYLIQNTSNTITNDNILIVDFIMEKCTVKKSTLERYIESKIYNKNILFSKIELEKNYTHFFQNDLIFTPVNMINTESKSMHEPITDSPTLNNLPITAF